MQRAHLAQGAVDAMTDAQEAGLGLEVQVGGAARGGIGEQCVDQAHHQLRVARRRSAAAVALFERAHQFLDRARLAVVLVDRASEFALAGQPQLDVDIGAELGAQAVEGDDVVGVGHGHDQAVAGRVVLQRQQAVAARQGVRHAGDRVRVGERGGQVHTGQAAAGGEHFAQRGLADEAELDQHMAEWLAAVMLFVEGDAQLVFADEAGGEQGLADGQGRVHGWRSVEVEAGSGLAPAGNSSGRSGMCGKLRCPGEGALVRKSSSGRCAA